MAGKKERDIMKSMDESERMRALVEKMSQDPSTLRALKESLLAPTRLPVKMESSTMGIPAPSYTRKRWTDYGASFTRAYNVAQTSYFEEEFPIEYDNAGNILGYKYLDKIILEDQTEPIVVYTGEKDGLMKWLTILPDKSHRIIYYMSPVYYGVWLEGHLKANVIPEENNIYGIYCARHPESSNLSIYNLGTKNQKKEVYGIKKRVLVQLLLCGTVLIGENGYRAEEAYILGEV